MSEESEINSLDLMTDKLINEMQELRLQTIDQQRSDLEIVKKTIPTLLEMLNELNKTRGDVENRLKQLEKTTVPGQQMLISEMVTLKKTIPEQQKIIDSQKADIKQLNEEMNVLNLNLKTIPELQKLIEEQRSELDSLKEKIDSQMADNGLNKTRGDVENRLKQLEKTTVIVPTQQISINEMVTQKKTIIEQQRVIDSLKAEIKQLNDGMNGLNLKRIPEQQKLLEEQRNELDSLKETISSQMAEIKQLTDVNNFKSNPAPIDLLDKKKCLNYLVPVGGHYISFYGQSSPQTLWSNTRWEDITSTVLRLFLQFKAYPLYVDKVNEPSLDIFYRYAETYKIENWGRHRNHQFQGDIFVWQRSY